MAESGRLSFPPSAAVPSTETDVTRVCQMTNPFLIDWRRVLGTTKDFPPWYDPPGIPLSLKLLLASFSNLNPCPSNCCYNGAVNILVQLVGVLSEFLPVVQAKKGTIPALSLTCRRQPVPVSYWRGARQAKVTPPAVPNAPRSRHHSRRALYEIKRVPMEGSWAPKRQCRAQVGLRCTRAGGDRPFKHKVQGWICTPFSDVITRCQHEPNTLRTMRACWPVNHPHA